MTDLAIDPVIEIKFRGEFLYLARIGRWEFATRAHGNEVAVIVAVTADRELVLVEQYRIPIQSAAIELPAGLIGDTPEHHDESVVQAAARELEEETGYSASHLRLLMRTPTSAGLTDETAVFYFAQGLQKVSAGGGDETEDITVHVVPLANINHWLKAQYRAGKAIDPKIYSALYWLQNPESVDLNS